MNYVSGKYWVSSMKETSRIFGTVVLYLKDAKTLSWKEIKERIKLFATDLTWNLRRIKLVKICSQWFVNQTRFNLVTTQLYKDNSFYQPFWFLSWRMLIKLLFQLVFILTLNKLFRTNTLSLGLFRTDFDIQPLRAPQEMPPKVIARILNTSQNSIKFSS